VISRRFRLCWHVTWMIYNSVSQTFFKWEPLLLVRMFYGPPYSCPLWKQIVWDLNYSVWYAIGVNFIFLSFFGLMFNLRGPQGQNPRTTVWETLIYKNASILASRCTASRPGCISRGWLRRSYGLSSKSDVMDGLKRNLMWRKPEECGTWLPQ
jgi:hypothetical protein